MFFSQAYAIRSRHPALYTMEEPLLSPPTSPLSEIALSPTRGPVSNFQQESALSLTGEISHGGPSCGLDGYMGVEGIHDPGLTINPELPQKCRMSEEAPLPASPEPNILGLICCILAICCSAQSMVVYEVYSSPCDITTKAALFLWAVMELSILASLLLFTTLYSCRAGLHN